MTVKIAALLLTVAIPLAAGLASAWLAISRSRRRRAETPHQDLPTYRRVW